MEDPLGEDGLGGRAVSPAPLWRRGTPVETSRRFRLPQLIDVAPGIPAVVDPARVLLITEGTYPFHFGGVSTWCDSLLRSLPDVRFLLLALVGDRKRQPLFSLPPNVEEFQPVSLWGSYDLLETRHDLSFDEIRARRRATTETAVQDHFIPAFRSYLSHLFQRDADTDGLARAILRMHRFFISHDFDAALRSRAAWNAFAEVVSQEVPPMAERQGIGPCEYDLVQLTRAMQWTYRWLFPLARPIPKVDVVHAAMAGLCTLVAVAAKLEHGAGYLLTEHGIYLRESYLAAARSRDGGLLKLLRLAFARRMTELSYAWADQVAPVCEYNHRWELRVGAEAGRLRTMYYGVDSTRFQPVEKTSPEPVVVWVGRIDPLKDLHTLLRAAGIVHRARPDIRFRLYGGSLPGAEAYHQECLALRRDLGLEEAVVFAGYVDKPAAAFHEGDVVVLCSISEAMPFSNLEAMLCGKPVIATAVGGVPEQLAGCGAVVEPRNPEQLARTILDLMDDPERRQALGRAARAKAMSRFSVAQFAGDHQRTYWRLSKRHRSSADAAFAAGAHGRAAAGRGHTLSGPPAEPAPAIRSSIDRAAVAQAVLELEQLGTSPPVDSLEVAALLESMGVTDEVAIARYRARDVFDLAECVLEQLRARDTREDTEYEDEPSSGRLRSIRQLARGPLGLAQLAVMLSILAAFATLGGWSRGQVLALGLGMTASILVTSSLIQATGRRPSIYLGLGDRVSARAALRLGTLAACACVTAVAIVAAAAALLAGGVTVDERLIFMSGFLAFSAIWIAAAGLLAAQATEWVVVALAAALLLGVAVDRGLSSLSSAHLAAGAAAGFAGAIGLLLAGAWRAFGGNEDVAEKAVLPSPGYLLHEAGPYVAHSSLYMVFILLPHILGWLGAPAPGQTRSAAIESLERLLTLGLPPVVIASGLAEHAVGRFWRRAPGAQRATPGRTPAAFGELVLRRLYGPQLRRQLLVLLAISLAIWLTIESGVAAAVASPWLQPPGGADAQAVFSAALVAYGLLGWGLFNSTYALTLGRPELALRDLLPAIGVVLLAGIPLSLVFGSGYAVIAFVLGAAVFVRMSSQTARSLLRAADYHYFASI